MKRYDDAQSDIRKLDITHEQKMIMFDILRNVYRENHDMKMCANCDFFMHQEIKGSDAISFQCGHPEGLLMPKYYDKCNCWKLLSRVL